MEEYLKSLAPFVYLPNIGNLGDLLIAEATRQYFRQIGVEYREYNSAHLPDKYNLVFAGGGKITNEWLSCGPERFALVSAGIKQCVVLPHSINGPNEFLQVLDSRYVLICRERNSYEHCKRHAPHVGQVLLKDDMAIGLDMKQVEEECADLSQVKESELLNEEEKRAFRLLQNGFAEKLKRRVRESSVVSAVGGEYKRIAFLLRRDREKASLYSSDYAFDISLAWGTSGRAMRFNANLLHAFSEALKEADVIVTDRLHCAIMSWHSGRETYMLDNSYKKLSGVYAQSLADEPNVHLLDGGRLTPELEYAWDLFTLKKMQEEQCKILYAINASRLRRRLYVYRVLKELTWGKLRRKIKDEYKALKSQVACQKAWREF